MITSILDQKINLLGLNFIAQHSDVGYLSSSFINGFHLKYFVMSFLKIHSNNERRIQYKSKSNKKRYEKDTRYQFKKYLNEIMDITLGGKGLRVKTW